MSNKQKPAPLAFAAGREPPEPAAAYSLNEFCAAHRIGRAFYYKLKAQGLGPREMRLGSRVIITREAAERWRREREAATQAAAE